MKASACGHSDVVQLLISAGSRLDVKDDVSKSLLYYTVNRLFFIIEKFLSLTLLTKIFCILNFSSRKNFKTKYSR